LLVAFSLLLSQSCNEKRRQLEAQKDNKAQQLSEKLQQDTYKDQKAKGVSETLQEWNMIGNFGIVRTLYVSPEGLKDKFYMAQVLLSVMRKENKSLPIQIMIFDNQRLTPRDFPMTDAQMLHWKAIYNRNPNTNLEKFVWISVKNPNSSPPALKETVANIRPGYAE